MSVEKSFIHQEHNYASFCHQNTANHRTFKKRGITKIQNNVKSGVRTSERNSST